MPDAAGVAAPAASAAPKAAAAASHRHRPTMLGCRRTGAGRTGADAPAPTVEAPAVEARMPALRIATAAPPSRAAVTARGWRAGAPTIRAAAALSTGGRRRSGQSAPGSQERPGSVDDALLPPVRDFSFGRRRRRRPPSRRACGTWPAHRGCSAARAGEPALRVELRRVDDDVQRPVGHVNAGIRSPSRQEGDRSRRPPPPGATWPTHQAGGASRRSGAVGEQQDVPVSSPACP